MFFRSIEEFGSTKKHYFYPMIRRLICIFLCLFSLSVSAQNKKKKKYDAYWAQEEKKEQFESLKDSAHIFFQRGHLEWALGYYQKALMQIPSDQFTKAKIQDLLILEEDIFSDIMGLLPKVKESLKMTLDDAQDSLRKLEKLTSNYRIEESEETLEALQIEPDKLEDVDDQKSEPKAVKVESPTPELPKVRTVNTQPKEGFNLTEFKEALLEEYPSGVAEETIEKKRSTIYRRVVVLNKDANEYLKVVHFYGATFYFKNKQSVTQNVWLKEAFIK